VRFGGLARRATWVKEVKEKEKGVLLLDAGDLFFKKFSPHHGESEIQKLNEKAHLILKSFELMGYHAIGIGDDDLSLGKKFLIELSKTTNVTFLSSNVMDEDSGKLLFQRYIIKEVNGLKVGIFSLLSQDPFLGPSDPRKKGLIFLDPVETAQEMVRELRPQTDLILLLSHLGYPKDVELAQKIPGIHIIIGSHTGVDLANPPVIRNTIIVQNSSKGMYGRILNVTFSNKEATFYNIKTKHTYERNLARLRQQLSSTQASEAEKNQWQRAVENIERTLQQFEQRNSFAMTSLPLEEAVKDHPEIKKMVDDYKSKFPEISKPPVHDSRGVYKPKSH
jgi:2',3'-cyclic-nucleotide 2'-phosphodiesterase (5'-nucleotidase family)